MRISPIALVSPELPFISVNSKYWSTVQSILKLSLAVDTTPISLARSVVLFAAVVLVALLQLNVLVNPSND